MPDSVTPTPYHHFIPTPTPGISPLPTPGTSPVTVSQMGVAGTVLPLLLTLTVALGIIIARRKR